MTQETIYAELKKMQMQMIPHVHNAIKDMHPQAQHLVLTDHHLGLAIYYFTQKLKQDEVSESSELHQTEGRDQHTSQHDSTGPDNEHKGDS